MLSWITTLVTYSSNIEQGNFSAAGTDFIDLPLSSPDGDTGTKDTHQNIQEQHQNRIQPTEETALLRQHSLFPHNSHSWLGREQRDGGGQRPQPETLPRKLSPQPLALYGTFDTINNLRQHDDATRASSHACSVARAAPNSRPNTCNESATRTDTEAGADDKPSASNTASASVSDGGFRLSGVARQVRDAAARAWEECATGGAFVRSGQGAGSRESYKGEESRKSAAFATQGVFALDGVQDEVEDRKGRAKGGEGGLSVKDKIAALESRKEARQHAAPTVPKSRAAIEERTEVPIVYPLHYKRFVRRTSSATPVRPETPLYRSTVSDEEKTILAPQPMRSFPSLKSPSETSPTPTPPRNHVRSETPKNGQPRRKKFTAIPQRREDGDHISPAAFLHGTKDNCVRHGRRRQPTNEHQCQGTNKMLAKSRSGAYIPTGLPSRRQMEATSPWVLPAKPLTATGSNACPDCVAELKIKRREITQASMETVARSTDRAVKPLVSSATDASIRPLARTEASSHNHKGRSHSSDTEDLIITRDLGDKFDAFVVERAGVLQYAVINSQTNHSAADIMQRLSNELARLSKSILSPGDQRPSATTAKKHHYKDCAIVAETLPNARETRWSSVPELLDMIDQAANEIHLNTGKLSEHYVQPRCTTGADQSPHSARDFEHTMKRGTSPAKALAGRQDMDEQYRKMHELLASASRKSSVTAANNASSTAPLPLPTSSMPNGLNIPAKAAKTDQSKIPRIVQTRPTLPSIKPILTELPDQTAPPQTPPPNQPSLHHAVELENPPTSTAPAYPTPKTQEQPHQHGFFDRFLNPFHHDADSKAAPSTHQPEQSLFTSTPTSSLSPLTAPSTAALAAVASAMKDIRTHPNPYHHAPATPLHRTVAQYVEKEVEEHQRVVRQAIDMGKDKVGQDTSAVERELRRQKSALDGEKKGA